MGMAPWRITHQREDASLYAAPTATAAPHAARTHQILCCYRTCWSHTHSLHHQKHKRPHLEQEKRTCRAAGKAVTSKERNSTSIRRRSVPALRQVGF
jgi:hypothetical protein